MSINLTLGVLRQAERQTDLNDFDTSLVYIVSSRVVRDV